MLRWSSASRGRSGRGREGGQPATASCRKGRSVSLDPASFTTTIFPAACSRWSIGRPRRWTAGGRARASKTKRIANESRAWCATSSPRTSRRVTDDWYAQDDCGNVWYPARRLGVRERQGVSTQGSFEAGRRAGVIIPPAGWSYRQEYYAGEAEDRAEIVSLRRARTPRAHDRNYTRPKCSSTSSTPEVSTCARCRCFGGDAGKSSCATRAAGDDVEWLVPTGTAHAANAVG